MYIAAIIIIVVTAFGFIWFASGADVDEGINLLQSYGWQVERTPVDQAEVIIPDPFDLVYENYNKLQIEAGLDLLPYRGMHGRRYTYTVINYPVDVGEPVLANVICIDGKAVAGDIMTVSSNGFMHSLKYDAINK